MPPPDPVPLEGGAAGSTAAMVPRLGMWLSAMCTCGELLSVLRLAVVSHCEQRIWGGVICCIATFGNLPLGAGNGSWSPPPPPPLTIFLLGCKA